MAAVNAVNVFLHLLANEVSSLRCNKRSYTGIIKFVPIVRPLTLDQVVILTSCNENHFSPVFDVDVFVLGVDQIVHLLTKDPQNKAKSFLIAGVVPLCGYSWSMVGLKSLVPYTFPL